MSIRNERLKEVIREESAQTITQDLADPRLGFCTVTRVELTDDLAYCTVHVSVLGDDGVKSRTMRALKDARGLIQSRIAKRLKTRTTPHLTIQLDESIERAFAVLDKIKQARATDPDGGQGEDETPKRKRGAKKDADKGEADEDEADEADEEDEEESDESSDEKG
jgi:ribosome-binding factor A